MIWLEVTSSRCGYVDRPRWPARRRRRQAAAELCGRRWLPGALRQPLFVSVPPEWHMARREVLLCLHGRTTVLAAAARNTSGSFRRGAAHAARKIDLNIQPHADDQGRGEHPPGDHTDVLAPGQGRAHPVLLCAFLARNFLFPSQAAARFLLPSSCTLSSSMSSSCTSSRAREHRGVAPLGEGLVVLRRPRGLREPLLARRQPALAAPQKMDSKRVRSGGAAPLVCELLAKVAMIEEVWMHRMHRCVSE